MRDPPGALGFGGDYAGTVDITGARIKPDVFVLGVVGCLGLLKAINLAN